MKVEIVVDPSKPPPLSQRVSAAPGKGTKATPKVAKMSAKTPKKTRFRKKGTGGAKRPVKSAEDLDAEMMDYAANGPAAATSA
ncbi:hypothetical protein Clacol_000338 [Clathrus columnatus]|uniref:Chromatin target of PRMT1 protein C-terminal domain-containing protein n=1 Tax=Clathrus columnatus TaxID=1419009 RepID=A0AAV4ZWG4_9AGAM|nr:hypothetical protein Clacol_000338 [Clathrus columnatus]